MSSMYQMTGGSQVVYESLFTYTQKSYTHLMVFMVFIVYINVFVIIIPCNHS